LHPVKGTIKRLPCKRFGDGLFRFHRGQRSLNDLTLSRFLWLPQSVGGFIARRVFAPLIAGASQVVGQIKFLVHVFRVKFRGPFRMKIYLSPLLTDLSNDFTHRATRKDSALTRRRRFFSIILHGDNDPAALLGLVPPRLGDSFSWKSHTMPRSQTASPTTDGSGSA
jgi:hypothetical protein